jgi:hypothetical protein
MTDTPENGEPAQQDASPDRRELIKRLGKAAMLPMLVVSFIATDVTDAVAIS